MKKCCATTVLLLLLSFTISIGVAGLFSLTENTEEVMETTSMTFYHNPQGHRLESAWPFVQGAWKCLIGEEFSMTLSGE